MHPAASGRAVRHQNQSRLPVGAGIGGNLASNRRSPAGGRSGVGRASGTAGGMGGSKIIGFTPLGRRGTRFKLPGVARV